MNKLLIALFMVSTMCLALAQEPSLIQPGFNCAKASTRAEHLICSNKDLADLDYNLMQVYRGLMDARPDRYGKSELKKEQIEWIKKYRDACTTADCMRKEYSDRIEGMESEMMYWNKPAAFR